MTATTYNVSGGSTSAVATALSGTGGLTLTGGGLLILSGANTYQGPTTISGGTLQLAGGFDRLPTISAVVMAPGTVLDLNGNPQTIGSLSGSGTVLNSAALTVGTDSTDTTFSGTVTGSGDLLKTGIGTLTLAGANTYGGKTYINAGILQVGNFGTSGSLGPGPVLDNASLIFSLSGAATVANNISGTGSLTQAGLGTLIVTGTNSYSGGTYIDGGTLQLAGGPNRLPVGTEITIRTGALDLNGNNQVIGSLNNVSTSSGGGSSTVKLGTGTLSIGDGSNSSYPYTISGAGSLVLVGSGTVSLSGTNTYTGGTTVSAGNLVLGSTASIPATGKILIQSGGAVNVSGAYSTVTAWLNAGVIAPASAGALALTGNSNENINLAVAGGGTYTNISLGSVGADSYSGTLTPAGNTYCLGGGGGTLVMANNAALVDSTFARGLVINGNVTLSGSNSYGGGTTLNAGTLNIAGDTSLGAVPASPATNVTFAGNATLQAGASSVTLAASRNLVINPSVTATLDSNGKNMTVADVIGGSGGLAIVGGGVLTLSNSSTVSGGVQINGGTLDLAHPLAVQNSTVNLSPSGALNFAAGITSPTLGGLAGAGNLVLATVASQSVTLNVGNNGQSTTYSGNLSGGGGLTQTGPGILTLTGSNTYTGSTAVKAGTLQATSTASLPGYATAGKISVSNGGMLAVSAGGSGWTSANIASLLSSNGSGFASGSALGIDTTPGNLSYASNIAGSMGVTKLGANTLTLSGSDTYTGPTSINAGSLIVDGSLAKTAITVGGGATLGGTGSIGGSVTAAGGSSPSTWGTISLVDGAPATLTLSDAIPTDTVLTLGGSGAGSPSMLDFEVGAAADRILIAAGKVVVNPGGGIVNITPLAGFGPGTYDLLDFASGQASGLGYLSLATTSVDGYPLSLQSTPTAEQLVVQSVPEPGTLALLAAAAACGLAAARRMRHEG
jgi:autotransporter-associated beta strand protein